MTQALRTLPGNTIVPLVFGQTDLAVSQTDVQIPTAIGETGQATVGYTMPWPGEILKVVADLTTAGTAGSLTVGATIDGTEDADTTLTITTEATKTASPTRNTAVFAAGAVIGCEITTDGSWAPITADLVATVWVALWPS